MAFDQPKASSRYSNLTNALKQKCDACGNPVPEKSSCIEGVQGIKSVEGLDDLEFEKIPSIKPM